LMAFTLDEAMERDELRQWQRKPTFRRMAHWAIVQTK